MMHDVDSTVCHNCSAPLAGPYCSSCGQKAQPLNPTLRALASDVVEATLDVDGRTFRSVVTLLTAPGVLTLEYFRGRRARWIAPLRLYLLFSVVYFAAASFGGPVHVGITGRDGADKSQQIAELGNRTEAEVQQAVQQALSVWTARAMFVLVPLFAGFLRLATRRTGTNYPQQVIFAFHVHAAWFVAGAIAALADAFAPRVVDAVVSLAAFGYATWYFVVALRTVYGFTRRRAMVRAAMVGFAYWVVITLVVLAIALPVLFWH
jgi:hypothetical protein